MPRSLLVASLLLVFLAGCRKEDTPPAAPPDTARKAALPVDTSAKVATSAAPDTAFEAIRYIQLQLAEDSSGYFTMDDCRCTQGTAVFAKGQLTFATCGQVPSEGRYRIRSTRRDTAGITVLAARKDTLDTVTIRRTRPRANLPPVYDIRRSNAFDVESGTLFIDSRDSARFERRSWDCEEYQG